MDIVLIPKGRRWIMRRRGYYVSRMEQALAIICHELNITVDVMRSKARPVYIARKRKLIYLIMREMFPEHSRSALARLMSKDKSTLYFGLAQARKLVEADPYFARQVEDLRAAVRAKMEVQ